MCLPGLCCAGSALCCAGEMCCKCLCLPCSKVGVASKNFAKIGYVAFQFFWMLVSLLLLYTAKKLVDWLPSSLQCPEQAGDGSTCMGPSAMIRMSFVLACFHAVVFLVILARNTSVAIFHDGCWGTKFLLVLAFFIGTMWIPNDFFRGYMDFSRIVSIFFLLCQALLMLVVSYKINETLVGNYEREQNNSCSATILIGLTVVITLGDVVWLVYQYIWYHSCGYNTAIITVTLIASISFYVLVLLRTREDASILTSAIVVTYLLYLQWSALASNPDAECNPFGQSGDNTIA